MTSKGKLECILECQLIDFIDRRQIEIIFNTIYIVNADILSEMKISQILGNIHGVTIRIKKKVNLNVLNISQEVLLTKMREKIYI